VRKTYYGQLVANGNGGIMITILNKTRSMGKPLPGVEIAIAEVNGKQLKIITEPNVQGQLVLKGFPSLFLICMRRNGIKMFYWRMVPQR
jgi:acyl-coenzyme A synthetase/AMP-(fatty) acid ligase